MRSINFCYLQIKDVYNPDLSVKDVICLDENKNKGAFRSRTAFLNRHFKPVRTKYDWMNSDPNEVDRFIEDPLAGYVGTVGYYYYQYKYIQVFLKYLYRLLLY